ncbi:Na(+)/H(+) antiporter subunit B [Kurthia senegalensis]|uniref:Na(+)/H(+) antiporter subunit B n=1 Tax=Kurthia senegalensis TaxID=1033740 RepID=UPI000289FA57|nr:Na(+)/H(+) antiporter subunit B [Kurthia senegalensis]
MRINDLLLKTVVRIVVFIILTLAIYLFFAGHYSPGGGFIGGLVIASAFVLLYLTYDLETVQKGIPVDFKVVAAIGVLLAVGTGFGSVLFGVDFLTQTAHHFNLPLVGDKELGTVMIFELGVALTVVGVVMTIITSIAEGDED